MSRLAKLECSAFSALCLLTASADPAERLISSAAVLAVSFVSHFIFYLFRKFLTPVFQVLFILVLISTLFEALRFLFPFSFPGVLSQAVFSAFLVSISSQKISEKFDIGALFLIFILVSVSLHRASSIFSEFYPIVFIVIAVIFACINTLYVSRKKSR